MENQVSIIINGVRYDAVRSNQINDKSENCKHCDLYNECNERTMTFYLCSLTMGDIYHFKKSDKKFEP